MLMTSLLGWWYVEGWREQLTRVKWAFIRMADRFSIGLMVKTLFAPFRQISADEQARGNNLATVITDKLVSRLIGCFMRTIMIIVGTITLLLLAVVSLIRLLLWPLLPVMPVVGIILMIAVGAPWKVI